MQLIREELKSGFNIEVLDSDTPLMLSGLDSSDAPLFVEHLVARFGVTLPATLVLEASTILSLIHI